MIFCLASIFLFAVVSANLSGRVDVVFPSVETSRSGVKTVKFRALNEEIELKLEPAGEILAENFALLDGKNQIRHTIDVEKLKSKLYRDSSNGAALKIDDDGPVTIQGIVNSKLRIAPHESGRTAEDGRIAHQIVEVISDDESFGYDAVMRVNVNEQIENVGRIARDDQCIVVEYLAVTESNFTKRFLTDEYLTQYISVLYLGVQNIFDTLKMGIKVRLLGISSFTKETEPSFVEQSAVPEAKEYLNPYDLLSNMADYYCDQSTGLAKDADIIMLSVSRRLAELRDDNTLSFSIRGIAYLASVCGCYKVGIAFDDSDYFNRLTIVAHESAHLLGSPHDGEGPEGGPDGNPGASDCPGSDGYIMGNLRNPDNKFKLSECSKRCIKYLFSLPRASCVFEDCKSY